MAAAARRTSQLPAGPAAASSSASSSSGSRASGRGSGRPKPTKEVQLWDAILAASHHQPRPKPQPRQPQQQHHRGGGAPWGPGRAATATADAASPPHRAPSASATSPWPTTAATSSARAAAPALPMPPGRGPTRTPPPAAASYASALSGAPPARHFAVGASPEGTRAPAPQMASAASSKPSPARARTIVPSQAERREGDDASAGGRAMQLGKEDKATSAPAAAKAKPKHRTKHAHKKQNTNWASSQRHIAFRGKERETPKPPKPTKLKRVILLERAKAAAAIGNPTEADASQPELMSAEVDLVNSPTDSPQDESVHQQDIAGDNDGEQLGGGPEEDGQQAVDVERTSSGEQEQSEKHQTLPAAEDQEEHGHAQVPPTTPAVLEIDFNSPPPSPPPGSAEVQSIDATYCKQIISVELNQVMKKLLQELTRFQQRALTKGHDKARVKKRYVCGLREVQRSVDRKKAKCVIVTPNIERISSPEGGLFEAVESIVRTSQQNRIIVIFAMTRTSLGKAISKRLKVAAVAILDPSGAEEYYKQALTLAHQGRVEYRRMNKRKKSKAQAASEPSVRLPDGGRQPLAQALPLIIEKAVEGRARMMNDSDRGDEGECTQLNSQSAGRSVNQGEQRPCG